MSHKFDKTRQAKHKTYIRVYYASLDIKFKDQTFKPIMFIITSTNNHYFHVGHFNLIPYIGNHSQTKILQTL